MSGCKLSGIPADFVSFHHRSDDSVLKAIRKAGRLPLPRVPEDFMPGFRVNFQSS